MKIINSTLAFIVFALLQVSAAHAASGTDVGYYLGIKDATFSTSASNGPTFNTQAGLMAGVIAIGDLSGDLKFRAGGYYAERTAKTTMSSITSTLKFSYLDVPLTVLYKFNDMVGLFGGALLGLKVSDSCTGDSTICSDPKSGNANPKSFVSAAQLGFDVKFHPNWAGEIYYEIGLSDVSDYTKVSALSAGIMFIY